MQFSVQRDQFIRLLARAQGIVEKKSTVAVLSHILLETDGMDAVKLTCTDYDVVLMDRCPARVTREGKAVIGGKTLFDVIKVLPSVDVEFDKVDGERISVNAGSTDYSLPGFDPDDFPRIEKGDKEPSFSVPVSMLRRMILKTGFCMSQEEARMNLNGIYIRIREVDSGMALACVATDGHRLAKAEMVVDGKESPLDNDTGVIVHRKGITELKKILDSETGDVSIGFSSGEVVFRVGNASLFVREIDEDYPDYETVIPGGFEQEVLVDVPEFLDAMRRVQPLADPNALTVRLEVEPEKITLSSANPQTGSGRTHIYADYNGEPFAVGFNQRYLQECASVIEAPQLVFRMVDPGAPCLIEPSDPDEGALYVLMPVDEG